MTMFDHLDDAHPVRADATIRRAVADRSRSLRRQRQFVTAATALAVTVASIGVAFAITRPGPKHPVVVATQTPSTTTTITPPGPALACGALTPKADYGPSPMPPAGTPRSATARMGSITARLDGTAVGDVGPYVTNPKLTVTDGSQVVRADTVQPPKDMLGSQGVPTTAVLPWAIGGPEPGSGELCLARFAGSAEPLVVIGLDLGMAHCCVVLQAYTLDSAPPIEHNFANPGAVLQAGPAGALIISGDDNFDYAFTSYAESYAPLTVYEIRDAQFVDTTRDHLDLVAADAAKVKQAMDQTQSSDDMRGLTAAWAADECVLGQSSTAFSTIDRLNAEGKFVDPLGGHTWPQGSAYVAALRDLLAKHGYC